MSIERRKELSNMRREYLSRYARWGDHNSLFQEMINLGVPLGFAFYYGVVVITLLRGLMPGESCHAPLFSFALLLFTHAIIGLGVPIAYIFHIRSQPPYLQQPSLLHRQNRKWLIALLLVCLGQFLLLCTGEMRVGALGLGGQRSYILCVIKAPSLLTSVRWATAMHLWIAPAAALLFSRLFGS